VAIKANETDGNLVISLEGFTEDEIRLIWAEYLRSYLETDNAEKLAAAERQISAVSAARSLFASVFVPGVRLIPRSSLLICSGFRSSPLILFGRSLGAAGTASPYMRTGTRGT